MPAGEKPAATAVVPCCARAELARDLRRRGCERDLSQAWEAQLAARACSQELELAQQRRHKAHTEEAVVRGQLVQAEFEQQLRALHLANASMVQQQQRERFQRQQERKVRRAATPGTPALTALCPPLAELAASSKQEREKRRRAAAEDLAAERARRAAVVQAEARDAAAASLAWAMAAEAHDERRHAHHEAQLAKQCASFARAESAQPPGRGRPSTAEVESKAARESRALLKLSMAADKQRRAHGRLQAAEAHDSHAQQAAQRQQARQAAAADGLCERYETQLQLATHLMAESLEHSQRRSKNVEHKRQVLAQAEAQRAAQRRAASAGV